MKTVTPKPAVRPDHLGAPVASEPEATSSNTPVDTSGNPVSTKGEQNPAGMLGYEDVHCYPSKPGKFDFGFIGDGAETAMATPKQPSGTYPITEGREEANTVPTHAPGTYVPAVEADTKPKGA